jgi:hypothetical protein
MSSEIDVANKRWDEILSMCGALRSNETTPPDWQGNEEKKEKRKKK